MIGKTLAHYEVISKLGEGGMGAVYLAKDTKLGREVALKILPDQFAKDQERLARFHREARTLAALNHPNIAAIHGLESDQGINFLAMELADGDDLSVLIERGPIQLDEALKIARDIARGLEEAHQNGIIHRDLKPANVKVSVDGKVKVLDFGLARAFMGESTAEEEPLNSPTITAAMTGAGVILGTAAYMSPEQARGTGVDRRTDIWSFGAVLYEMLTGNRLFQGNTISDTLAGILKSDPDWDALPDDTTDTVRLLLMRCLERDRTQRLQDIGEARILLSGDGVSSLYSSLSMSKAPEGELAAKPASRRPLLLYSILALVLGAALGGLVMKSLAPAETPLPHRRLEIALPEGSAEIARDPQISPDGTMAVYVMNESLWLRRLGTGLTQELPSTEEANNPFWSPDSKQVGFFVKGSAKRIAVDGGSPQKVCDMPGSQTGSTGTWDDLDRFLFTLGDEHGIMEVPSRGGVPVTYVAVDTTQEGDFHDPHAIKGGRGLLFSSHRKDGSFTQLYHYLDGKRTLLFDGGGETVVNPVWCETGHVLFRLNGANGGIWALKFDPAGSQILGDPFLALGDGLWPSVAADGTLLCGTGSGTMSWQLVKCDRTGRVVSSHGKAQDFFPFFTLGPQGRRMVLPIEEDTKSQIWMIDLERGTQSRLTFDDNTYTASAWTADGEFIIAPGGDGGPQDFELLKISVEGKVPAKTLSKGLFPMLTPDGSKILYSVFSSSGGINIVENDMGALESASDYSQVESRMVVQDPEWQYGGQISPDGRLLAYVSRETGRDEIYMRRYPQGDQKRQISADGGGWPMWNDTGDRLYFMHDEDMMEVEIERAPNVLVGTPQVLFTRPKGEDRFGVGWPLYFQVTGDGQFFYLLHQVNPDKGGRPLTIVQNWVAEFVQE